jgi:N-acylneuraminate cytidylyltransferase
MKIVSVILARGGSKGIPKKNIINLKGKPLISYVITESLKSNTHETWVCTDSDEISNVSLKYGAKILLRPDELSTDTSKSEDSLIFFANNVEFDYLVFIQPTSPLLTYNFINEGLDMVTNNKFDSVFSAYKEHWIPRWSKSNIITPNDWDIYNRPRRQDVDEKLVENGAFYITSKKSLLENKIRYSGNIGVVEMPFSKSIQIDTYDDLKMVERLL